MERNEIADLFREAADALEEDESRVYQLERQLAVVTAEVRRLEKENTSLHYKVQYYKTGFRRS